MISVLILEPLFFRFDIPSKMILKSIFFPIEIQILFRFIVCNGVSYEFVQQARIDNGARRSSENVIVPNI